MRKKEKSSRTKTWQQQLQEMTHEEKEFMWDTNRRMNSKFRNTNPYINYRHNEKDFIIFINVLKRKQNIPFYYAGLGLARDVSNKLGYSSIYAILPTINEVFEYLKASENLTEEQEVFLKKWLPLLEKAKETGIEEGVKNIEDKLFDETSQKIGVLIHKFYLLSRAFERIGVIGISQGKVRASMADEISDEERESIARAVEKEFYQSLNKDEIESVDNIVERLNTKYYLDTYKTHIQIASENFFRSVQKNKNLSL